MNLHREIYENVDINITNDNKYIIFPSKFDCQLEIWLLESKICLYTIPYPKDFRVCIATSPDSRYLFYTSESNEVTQIEIEQNRPVAKYKGIHVNQLAAIAVSSDGKLFVSAGYRKCGNFCFYKVDTSNDETVETSESYGNLQKIDGSYWVTIFMHGKEGQK